MVARMWMRVVSRTRCTLLLALALAMLFDAAPAAAQDDYGDSSGKTLTVTADLRLIAASGEPSWTDGGFGKTRFWPSRDRFQIAARAIEGDVVWQPHLSWSLDATIAAMVQQGADNPGLSEAYLSFRREPHGNFRARTRAGLFWPPVSLEHSGPEWAVTDTITPSAINSWIGEEVKVGGVEVGGQWRLGGHRLSLSGALFGFNQTAGTLLAFRGWALHDVKVTAFGLQHLPPLDAFMIDAQAPRTRPMLQLGNRPGYYVRLAWAPPFPVKLSFFYYDNRGDPEAVTAETLQWGWRTRFANIGAVIDSTPTLRFKAQAMTGRAEMGFPEPDRIWVDTRFRSVYLLATQTIGQGSISARVEAFGTTGEGSILGADESETGWATTFAAKRSFGRHVTVLGEVLHTESTRQARVRAALNPRQPQTLAQLAVRLRL
jgi:hypothetical protein